MKTFLSCSRNLETNMAHARIQMIPLKGYTFILPLIPTTCIPLETQV